MATRVIYFFLLILMVYILYHSGLKLRQNYRILSSAGIAALLAYTLNEGLRFGRGIDYNAYWYEYELMELGKDNETNIGFYYLENFLISLDIPWQGCVMFMSFMFILGILFFLKNYKEVIPIALPVWILFYHGIANNLMRWNLAYSFLLIGFYFFIKANNKLNLKFLICCCLGCSIHYAMLPIPILYYWVSKRGKPIMSPKMAFGIFVLLSLLFQTEFMLRFVDLFNMLASYSEKFEVYGNDAEYWLTKSAGGLNSSWIGLTDTLLGIFIVLVGHKHVSKSNHAYLFVYNLYLLGFVFRPAAIQIELILRYDELFMYFKSIMFAYIVFLYQKRLLYYRDVRLISLSISCLFVLFFYTGTKETFKESEFKLWYVWDKGDKTPSYMMDLYEEDSLKKFK